MPSSPTTWSAHNTYGIIGREHRVRNSDDRRLPAGRHRGRATSSRAAPPPSTRPATSFRRCPRGRAISSTTPAGDYHLTPASAYRKPGSTATTSAPTSTPSPRQTAIALSGDNRVPPGHQSRQHHHDGASQRRAPAVVFPVGGLHRRRRRLRVAAERELAAGRHRLRRGRRSHLGRCPLTCRPARSRSRHTIRHGRPTAPASHSLLTIDPPPFVVTMPAVPGAQVGVAVRADAGGQRRDRVPDLVGSHRHAALGRRARLRSRERSPVRLRRGARSRRSCRRRIPGARHASTPSRSRSSLRRPPCRSPAAARQRCLPPAVYRDRFRRPAEAVRRYGRSRRGSCPEGITLDAGGKLSGTPTAVGAVSPWSCACRTSTGRTTSPRARCCSR